MNEEFGEIKEDAQKLVEVINALDFRKVHELATIVKETFNEGNKLLICGNGGSAAQADHFEGELVGRFRGNRKPYAGTSLSLSTASNTCIGNDFGYEEIFSRGVLAYGQANDMLFALTTSGNSPNILRAVEAAKEKQMIVAGLLGNDGGKMLDLCDIAYVVDSESTARIQEAHIFIIHSICEYLENEDLHN